MKTFHSRFTGRRGGTGPQVQLKNRLQQYIRGKRRHDRKVADRRAV